MEIFKYMIMVLMILTCATAQIVADQKRNLYIKEQKGVKVTNTEIGNSTNFIILFSKLIN